MKITINMNLNLKQLFWVIWNITTWITAIFLSYFALGAENILDILSLTTFLWLLFDAPVIVVVFIGLLLADAKPRPKPELTVIFKPEETKSEVKRDG